jgi:Helix-turn-helix domain
MSLPESPKYPLLEEVLALRQMPLRPMYTIRDVAALFGVSVRAIQTRVASGQLPSRDLPGRAKFLPTDIEDFLQNSRRGQRK